MISPMTDPETIVLRKDPDRRSDLPDDYTVIWRELPNRQDHEGQWRPGA
jgi:hypothetical protein